MIQNFATRQRSCMLTSESSTSISGLVKFAMVPPSRSPLMHDLQPLPEVNAVDLLADDLESLSLETAEAEIRKQKRRSAARDKTENNIQSSAAKVFAIFELAEHILEDVRPQDLFIWKRVNTAFRDVINESARLQKALYVPAACSEEASPFHVPAVLPEFIFDWHTDREKQAWHRPYPQLKQGELEIASIFDVPELEADTAYTWMSLSVARPLVKHVTMLVHKSCFAVIHEEEVKQNGGVTVGDLVNAAIRYFAPFRQHKLPYRYRFVLRNEECRLTFGMEEVQVGASDMNLARFCRGYGRTYSLRRSVLKSRQYPHAYFRKSVITRWIRGETIRESTPVIRESGHPIAEEA
ncbi:uncharacterized protein MYCFIDRAFT_171481 [Pseudocercospora fijiensis CIRAD86]|uniref:F-box domain-containing protein n=1 Tax=Pseudocercospora fijiensis (strain CIRAD86) TaxID=383855 RepID=M3B8C8_PSEFD|nr:uncharacterized protein MYCFIDRAFT_171481 [Pseudocercospora fijiensis CIRAD86]EME85577.1 hypothetical protein MYCFIDRAFT_171481 [Pseudocercospora fijiensis CIRAD86]